MVGGSGRYNRSHVGEIGPLGGPIRRSPLTGQGGRGGRGRINGLLEVDGAPIIW